MPNFADAFARGYEGLRHERLSRKQMADIMARHRDEQERLRQAAVESKREFDVGYGEREYARDVGRTQTAKAEFESLIAGLPLGATTAPSTGGRPAFIGPQATYSSEGLITGTKDALRPGMPVSSDLAQSAYAMMGIGKMLAPGQ